MVRRDQLPIRRALLHHVDFEHRSTTPNSQEREAIFFELVQAREEGPHRSALYLRVQLSISLRFRSRRTRHHFKQNKLL